MKTPHTDQGASARHSQLSGCPTWAARGVLARYFAVVVFTCSLIFAITARGQWVTESYPLLSGWNGIWVSQDCSHATIDQLLASSPAVEEVWLWNPVAGGAQFSSSPSTPLASDVAWQVWKRGKPAETTLTKLLPNSSYLVKASGTLTLSLTGRPVPPRNLMTSLGTNFVGFPMVQPDSANLRSIERFFSFDSVLKSNPPVYGYNGGNLTPNNPGLITAPLTTPLRRNKAYWINAADTTNYYGPVEVTVLGSSLDFGGSRGFVTIRLRNAIDPARNLPVTATLAPAPSAVPPVGQAPIAGMVPLLVRGQRDAQTLDFTYAPLGGGITRTLGPGEQTEVTLALDRTTMGSTTGAVFQSLLQVTDSLNLTRIDLGVRAEVPSFTGIWIGAAVVAAVDQTIGQTTVPDAPAPSGFPIRFILHRADSGQVTVLQQVYVGEAAGVSIASASEERVTASATGKIARFSSASFPLGSTWTGTGGIGLSGTVNFDVPLAYNASTNPFVHTYHPDHDNLDARFRPLPAGVESPNIVRAVTLTFQPNLPGVTDGGLGSTTLGGTYRETITGLRSTPVTVSGAFVLRRVAPTPALINP